MNEKELKLLKLAESRGVRIDWKMLDRSFVFKASGIVTYDRDIYVFNNLADQVTFFADEDGFTCDLRSIIVFPIICDPLIYARTNFISYKRNRSVFVGMNIPHGEWKAASEKKRATLAKKMLGEAIISIREKALSDIAKLTLLFYIEIA